MVALVPGGPDGKVVGGVRKERGGDGAVSSAAACLMRSSDCGRPCRTQGPIRRGLSILGGRVETACNIKPCGLWAPAFAGATAARVAAELVPTSLVKQPACAGTASRSRRTFRASFALSFRQEGAGNAGCALPRGRCAAKSTRVSNQGYTATAGIPCTVVLTVFLRALPR